MLRISGMVTSAKEGPSSPQNGSGISKQATVTENIAQKINDRVHFTLSKVYTQLITYYTADTVNI